MRFIVCRRLRTSRPTARSSRYRIASAERKSAIVLLRDRVESYFGASTLEIANL